MARLVHVRLVLALLTAVCTAGAAVPALGEIYRWHDASGRLHFSQDLEKVPPAKRAEAQAAARAPRKRDPLQTYSSPSRAGGDSAGAARRAMLRSGRTMRIPFEQHGTLMKVDVRLNDRVTAPFYIDTGASGISIPYATSKKLGIHIGPDTPRRRVTTANGVVSEPVVRLKSVQLGPARVTDLEAAISGSMQIGLLGGSFFNNFVYQVDAAAGVITLRPNQRVRGGLDEAQWRERFQSVRAPLSRLEAYLEKGGFLNENRVRELEARREELRSDLEQLEKHATRASVPQGWRR